jgi:hypothetical protein
MRWSAMACCITERAEATPANIMVAEPTPARVNLVRDDRFPRDPDTRRLKMLI